MSVGHVRYSTPIMCSSFPTRASQGGSCHGTFRGYISWRAGSRPAKRSHLSHRASTTPARGHCLRTITTTLFVCLPHQSTASLPLPFRLWLRRLPVRLKEPRPTPALFRITLPICLGRSSEPRPDPPSVSTPATGDLVCAGRCHPEGPS